MTKPVLHKKEEFRKVLADYHVSPKGKDMIANTTLVLLLSPTSAGRNSIIEILAESGRFEHIISDTTRPRRKKDGEYVEFDGVQYWFRSEDDILQDLKDGLFLEAELIHEQQVSGMSLRALENTFANGKIAINEVDIDGIDTIVQVKPDTVAVLVLPPNGEEWMRRLKGRSDMHIDELINRLNTAKRIFASVHEREYYKIVINDDLNQAAEEVRGIVLDNHYDEAQKNAGIQKADELYAWTSAELEKLENSR